MSRAIGIAFAACAAFTTIAACDLDERMPPSAEQATARAEERTATRLRDHLRALPGVVDVHVTLALAPADPFARNPRPPDDTTRARAAIALVLHAGADQAAIGAAAFTAARTLLGDDAAIAIDTVPTPPIATRDRTRAIAIAAAATVAAAALAAALALARRRAIARAG